MHAFGGRRVRYPPVLLGKMKDLKEALRDARAEPSQQSGVGGYEGGGVEIRGVLLKSSTIAALKKKGINETRKLRLATDVTMLRVV